MTITLIVGPMFSGKSSEMLRLLTRAAIAKRKVALVRPAVDTRDFLTHDNKTAVFDTYIADDTVPFTTLCASLVTRGVEVVGIDEGQFITGLRAGCDLLANNGLNVVVAGLSSTSEGNGFPEIMELLPTAETVIKLNAICTECGSEDGAFTSLKQGHKVGDVLVGGQETYRALCRSCVNVAYLNAIEPEGR